MYLKGFNPGFKQEELGQIETYSSEEKRNDIWPNGHDQRFVQELNQYLQSSDAVEIKILVLIDRLQELHSVVVIWIEYPADSKGNYFDWILCGISSDIALIIEVFSNELLWWTLEAKYVFTIWIFKFKKLYLLHLLGLDRQIRQVSLQTLELRKLHEYVFEVLWAILSDQSHVTQNDLYTLIISCRLSVV